MEDQDRRAIAMMALGFFFLVAFVGTEPGTWRIAWMAVAWIIFLFGFVIMIADRKDDDGEEES